MRVFVTQANGLFLSVMDPFGRLTALWRPVQSEGKREMRCFNYDGEVRPA